MTEICPEKLGEENFLCRVLLSYCYWRLCLLLIKHVVFYIWWCVQCCCSIVCLCC